jgi:hypothetical protein
LLQSFEGEEGQKTEAQLAVISYPSNTLPDSYRNVILSRWLRSLRQYNDYFKLIDKNAYFDVYEKYIKLIIYRPNTVIRLAVLKDDQDVVLGWSIIEGTILHYVHVPELWRGKGISDLLIPKDIKCCTHVTKYWLNMWQKKYKHVIFNPFL